MVKIFKWVSIISTGVVFVCLCFSEADNIVYLFAILLIFLIILSFFWKDDDDD